MGLFKRKADPISERARALNLEIAALEEKIRKLDSQLQHTQAQPRLRSTALPDGATLTHTPEATAHVAATVVPVHEPIFEEVDQDLLKSRGDSASTPEHYNDLGVRKYDLPALLRRLRNQFSGPATTNPKLVNYLAAGGIQGLRPLRYEKRVARNRFIALVAFLFVILLGIILAFVRR
jgi:hypothetical protein